MGKNRDHLRIAILGGVLLFGDLKVKKTRNRISAKGVEKMLRRGKTWFLLIEKSENAGPNLPKNGGAYRLESIMKCREMKVLPNCV